MHYWKNYVEKGSKIDRIRWKNFHQQIFNNKSNVNTTCWHPKLSILVSIDGQNQELPIDLNNNRIHALSKESSKESVQKSENQMKSSHQQIFNTKSSKFVQYGISLPQNPRLIFVTARHIYPKGFSVPQCQACWKKVWVYLVEILGKSRLLWQSFVYIRHISTHNNIPPPSQFLKQRF